MPDLETQAPPRAGRREWIGMAVLALPTLMAALDIGVLYLALPRMSADLHADATEQLWITDLYGFMIAGFLITMGSLGDRIGRRRLLMIGAAGFGLASVLSAFSTSPGMLIAARALLGVAGATLSPSTLALISNMFRDPRQMGLAISLWAGCQFGGAALGPVVGGLMLEHFWWGSVFLLGVPAMVLLMILGPRFLPEYRSPEAPKLDPVSVLLSLAAILPAVYGVKQLVAAGPGTSVALPWAALAFGVLVGVVFVRRQLHLANPLLDLHLFRSRSFSSALVAMLLASGVLAGVSLMTSQYSQSVLGLSPARAGLWQAPAGIGIAAGVLMTPGLVKRAAPALLIRTGLVASLAGLFVLTTLRTDGHPWVMAVGMFLAALGVGPLFALGTGLVMGSAPPAKAGSAASMSETSNILGSTLGLALLGSLGAFVYHHRVDGHTTDAAARQTVAGAVASSKTMAEGPGSQLLRDARDAFSSGVAVVAVTGVAVFVLLIALTSVALRRTGEQAQPAGSGSDHQQAGPDGPDGRDQNTDRASDLSAL
ncbi:MFS transporter [Catenulispora subtropica]|uniref:MFS transporter n=1 Tax=Catenulispora subtropica TaxID=450798 RepID=A0ABN2T2A0_9ACTN